MVSNEFEEKEKDDRSGGSIASALVVLTTSRSSSRELTRRFERISGGHHAVQEYTVQRAARHRQGQKKDSLEEVASRRVSERQVRSPVYQCSMK